MNDLQSKSTPRAAAVAVEPNDVEQPYNPDENAYMDEAEVDPAELKQKFDSYLPTYELCMGQGAKLRQFVHSMTVLPNVVITVANRMLLGVANDLAVLDASGKTDRRFEFYYVSAGPIGGGYYLSTLLCRQFLFDTEPIIPVAFLVHERRNADDHRRLFELIQEKCPDVASTECVFVTDREFGDIKSILPNAVQLYSWHYFEDDVVNWVETNCSTNDDANTYLSDVFSLLKLKTVEQFNHEVAAKRLQWPAEFYNFFDACLKPDILAKGGRWHSETLRGGVYNHSCGVVIPSCGDLNQLASDLAAWHEVTLENILLCVNYFCDYYVRENEKAMHQTVGSFKLQTRYVHYARPGRRSRAFETSEINDPRDIVNYVRAVIGGGMR